MKEKGQIVVLLLLVMVVALAIGLSMISRSILEVSTSRKSEDSSRAFSAAEAGIERALQANINNIGGTLKDVSSLILENQSGFGDIIPASLPLANTALEYPPFGKESYAQFWLANPNAVDAVSYNQASFDIYFGDPDVKKYQVADNGKPEDQPAIEVNVIYWDATSTPNKYQTVRRYFDSFRNSSDVAALRTIGFNPCDDTPPPLPTPITTNNNTISSSFYCRVRVTGYLTGSNIPIMVRVRILYSNISHPVALQPLGGGSLPKQANIYKSTGTSGSTQRTLEVFQEKAVMPQIFDYVLFSAMSLQKN